MQNTDNPLYHIESQPHHIPNFSILTPEHIRQALTQGLQSQRQEYQAIENNPSPATFENVVVALERSGQLLQRSTQTFYLLLGAHNNEDLNQIAQEYIPQLTAHDNQLYLNVNLYQKLQYIKDHEYADLNAEEQRMVDELNQKFVRNGINLSSDKRLQLADLDQRIAILMTQYQQNLLQASNQTYHIIENESLLEGLPSALIEQAKELAIQEGMESAWLFKANQATLSQFLTYMKHDEHRARYHQKYSQRCLDDQDTTEHQKIMIQISHLRLQKAKILGYSNYADYILEKNMAHNSQRVKNLLDTIWEPALKLAEQERDQLQKYANQHQNTPSKIQASDWWYYTEQLRQEHYAINLKEISQYFSCDQVLKGAFKVVDQLFGLQFVERHDLPKYHPDVRTFEVREKDQSLLGIFYADYYTRASKRNGAWMCDLYKSSTFDGKVYPVVFNVCNFPPPSKDQPSLLTPEHIRTLFHELGHALHGLCSQTQYPMLGGTNVPRDFVELPSQILENWGLEAEIMQSYSSHYQTHESIPSTLIAQLQSAKTFNQGFANVEYCAAAYLDLAWHMIDEEIEDVQAFEDDILQSIHLIDEIKPRYRSNYFAHIFAGGYAAGYYSYLWSAVLDKDAYQIFKQGDLFDAEHAQNLRQYIYASGYSQNPMTQYKKLCGREPQMDAVMQARGLVS